MKGGLIRAALAGVLSMAVTAPALAGSADRGLNPVTIQGPAPVGFYVAGTIFHLDASGVAPELASSNPATVSVKDNSRNGWGLEFGYQWADGVALQVSLVNLADVSIALAPNGASANQVDQAIRDLHPVAAQGVEIGVRKAWYFSPHWQAYVGGGLWYWRAEQTVDVAGTERSFDASSVNPTAELGLGWRFHEDLELRLSLHHLRFGDGYVNTLGLGLLYQW